MSKEGEGAFQHNLFASQPLKPTSPESSMATPAPLSNVDVKENDDSPSAARQSTSTERQAPAPTLREARALRSLLYNRLLLQAVERRIEKGAATIISYLLTQENLSAQIGPYFVWLAENNTIEAVKTLNDDEWQQLYLPEIEPESIK
jgi:hypothetical protein